ncbi:MAG: hypothetical protein F6K55_06755 [Moorea sp. SIO4A3]|nr:hypothetical protein [Moorena sp. SIO4A3]
MSSCRGQRLCDRSKSPPKAIDRRSRYANAKVKFAQPVLSKTATDVEFNHTRGLFYHS